MMTVYFSFACAMIHLLLSAVHGQGVPDNLIPTLMELNSGWTQMSFNLTSSPWIPNLYKTISPVPFKVVYSDAFCPGKMVSIYVNGTLKMNSTQVPMTNGTCDPRLPLPMATFAFPDQFSHAIFALPAGEHDIAIKVIQSDPKSPSGLMYLRSFISTPSECTK